jgi:hypothetical protein
MGYFITEKAARVVPGRSKYRHRFGGHPMHRVVGRPEQRFTLHCLYLLNTDDPGLPRVLQQRQWLPLYYPLFNNGCDFAYEVVGDEEIVVHRVSDRGQKDFPYPGFPKQVPERSVRVAPLSYDEQKTLVFAFTAQDQLNQEAISRSDQAFLKRHGYPFTQVGGIQFMMQGVPRNECPNPGCKYADCSNMHEVFAVVWNRPVPDFMLWGELGDFVQIIYQVCPCCSTIYTRNRCD